MIFALAALTYRRNEVFSTSDRFWRDVLAKAPSSRAHLNYGVSLMAANDIPAAMRQFEASLELAPYWYFTHINLGVANRSLGRLDRAREHFDRAVAYDRYSGHALSWRGEFYLALGEYAAARDDFLKALPLSLEHYRNAKGLAAAYAGLGDVPRSLEQTERMLALDRVAALADIPGVTMPSFQQAQEVLMASGLRLLGNGDPAAGAAAAAKFREVLALNPTHYGAHYQLAVALDRAGKSTEAHQLWEKVLRMAEGYNDGATVRTARSRLNEKPRERR